MAVLAPVLVRYRAEVNAWKPNRDHESDGWIGNKAHAETGPPESGGSDHNPNKRNIVNAVDIDVDGVDVPQLLAAAIRHPSTNYFIWNRKIWARSRNFKPAAYTGSNPHTKHAHLSTLQTVAAENNPTPWGIGDPGPVEGTWAQRLAASLPVLQQSPSTAPPRGSVRKAQALLRAAGYDQLLTDGSFGPLTVAAVISLQKARSLTADGIIGPKTWTVLLGDLHTVREGDHGLDVLSAQALLNAQDMFSGSDLGVDGYFGPVTTAAVKQFQTTLGLAVDGVLGPVTWTALLTR